MHPLSALLSHAIDAALAAGRAIVDIYDGPASAWEVEQKADASPLTAADRAAHAVIAARLTDTRLPLLSEEGAHTDYAERSQWERFWLTDPLDGTKEFLKRNGEFTVNIALVEAGSPRLGVVYVPARRRLYYGIVGEGAYRVDEVDSQTPAPQWLPRARRLPLPTAQGAYCVVASRSHLSAETEAFIHDLRTRHPDLQLHSAGSSLKLCCVAEGTAHVYPRLAPTMEWDTAAGDAVARSAGCQVVRFDTREPLRYNKPDLHNPHFLVCQPDAL